MDTRSANPPLNETKQAEPPHDPGTLVRTRLHSSKLAVVRPSSLDRIVAILRRRLRSAWQGVLGRIRHNSKLLVVSETASLGDRRTVCVVQFGRQQFLIGCGPSSVTLLARLGDEAGDTVAPEKCPASRISACEGNQ